MSITQKSLTFLGLTFALSWAVAIGAHFGGLRGALGPAGDTLILVGMMAGPAIAALICAFAFEKGRRVEALGLRFKPNLWWLHAWAIPIALAALSVLLTIFLSDRHYVDIGEALRATARAQGQDLSQAPAFATNTAFLIGVAVTLGALINTPSLTFTEELGWRGYLYHLWRPAGFWRTSLATGFIWGVWHAPAILLYGVNYPQDRIVGIFVFIPFCMLLAPLVTLMRERGGSTWAAGILHGTFNAVGGLTIVSLSAPSFPWNGIAGIGGFLALALGAAGVVLLQRRAPAPAAA